MIERSTKNIDHEFSLWQNYLKWIQNWKKTLELRLETSSYKDVSVWDIVRFYSSNREVCIEILWIRRYTNLDSLYENEDISLLAPWELINIECDKFKEKVYWIYRRRWWKSFVEKQNILIWEIKLLV